jgi:thiol-disulfide isomerase/thioredoxin
MRADHPGGGPAGPSVVLYGRPGCHLCEQAQEVLERVQGRVPFSLRGVDIDSDEELFKRYLELIPVIEIDGAKAFELFVDEAQLERLLRRTRDTTPPQVQWNA